MRFWWLEGYFLTAEVRVKRSKRVSAKNQVKKPILVVYVLDETGSMGSVKDATISGFNEYVRTLAGSKDSKLSKMSLITFNSEQGARRRFSSLPITQVKRLGAADYQPAACTPLYDAIMEGIQDGDSDTKSDIVLVIQTDGQENASRRAGRDEIFRLIEERKKRGWAVVFLGADQDAWNAAQLMGIPAGATISYDNTSSSTAQAFQSVANSVASYTAYSPSQRSDSSKGLTSYVNTSGASISLAVDIRKKKQNTL